MKIPKKYLHKSGTHKGHLNQALLQVEGNFKCRDPHPKIRGLLYLNYASNRLNPQVWATIESFKPIQQLVAPKDVPSKYLSRSNSLKHDLLQVKGSFSHRDPHPKVKGILFYAMWKGKQVWRPTETFKPMKSLPDSIPSAYLLKGGLGLNQEKLSTGSNKNTFVRGDKHPTIEGFYYKQWCPTKDRENWTHESSVFYKRYIEPNLGNKRRINQEVLQIKSRRRFAAGDKHPKVDGFVFKTYDRQHRQHWEASETRQARLDHRKKTRIYDSEKERLNRIKYFSNPENRVKKREKDKQHARKPESKIKRNAYLKKYNSKPINKLLLNVRNRINTALNDFLVKKEESTICLLGCSIRKLKKHIESNFKEGMAWDNFGEWHLDHIIPCKARHPLNGDYIFDLTKPSHQKVCFNYQNLQPMWASENSSKCNKIHWSIVLTLMLNNYKTIGLN
jgi:hypothetical protein